MSHLAIARLSLSAELPTERSKYLWHTGAKIAVLIPRSKSRLSISTRATERDLKCWWEVHASKHSLLQANLIQSEVGHPWSSYVSELTQVPSATLRSVVSRCLQGEEVINPMLSPILTNEGCAEMCRTLIPGVKGQYMSVCVFPWNVLSPYVPIWEKFSKNSRTSQNIPSMSWLRGYMSTIMRPCPLDSIPQKLGL